METTVAAKPEWIRLPKPGTRCPYTGLSRSTLYELVMPTVANGAKAAVRSKLVKTNPRNISGVRLIHLVSLLQYISESEGGAE